MKHRSRISAADDRRDTEFPCYDRSVRQRGSYVRYNGSCAREDRRPTDIGRSGDEYLTLLKLICILNIVYHMHDTRNFTCRARKALDVI